MPERALPGDGREAEDDPVGERARRWPRTRVPWLVRLGMVPSRTPPRLPEPLTRLSRTLVSWVSTSGTPSGSLASTTTLKGRPATAPSSRCPGRRPRSPPGCPSPVRPGTWTAGPRARAVAQSRATRVMTGRGREARSTNGHGGLGSTSVGGVLHRGARSCGCCTSDVLAPTDRVRCATSSLGSVRKVVIRGDRHWGGAVGATRSARVGSGTVLAVASAGAFLAFLDATVVNVAFPSIRESFGGASIGELSWVLNAYNIVLAATLILFGRLADLGRRRLFVARGRALLRCPRCSAPPPDRCGGSWRHGPSRPSGPPCSSPHRSPWSSRRSPSNAGCTPSGSGVRPRPPRPGSGRPIGGALVKWGGWRWAFLVNLPVGVAALVASRRMLVESRSPGRRQAAGPAWCSAPRDGHGPAHDRDRDGQRLGLDQPRRAAVRGRLRGGGARLRAELARAPQPAGRPGTALVARLRRRQRRVRGRRHRLLRLPADECPVVAVHLALRRLQVRSGARPGRRRRGRGCRPPRPARRAARPPRRRRAGRARVGQRLPLVRRRGRPGAELPARLAARAGAQRPRRGRDPADPRQRGDDGGARRPVCRGVRREHQRPADRWRARDRPPGRADRDPGPGPGRRRVPARLGLQRDLLPRLRRCGPAGRRVHGTGRPTSTRARARSTPPCTSHPGGASRCPRPRRRAR